jgi:HlyD family secretion protein
MAKKKSKKRLYIILAIIAIILIFAVLYGIFGKSDERISVTTAKVTKRTIVQKVSAIGKIDPETEVKISSEASGEIVYLGVKEGDTVRTGQVLIKIKPDIIETQLEQFKSAANASKIQIEVAKTEKERTEAELKRINELYAKDFASKQELDNAKAAFEKAVANYSASLARYNQSLSALKQVQRNAERTTIYSPINGVVTKLSVEKGEKVVGTAQFQGTELLRVADLSVINALVDVDENDIVLVNVGDTAQIEIDALQDVFFKGVVIEIGHSAEINQLGTADQVVNFKVKIRLLEGDNRLRPGMSCNAEIETEKKENVLAVPLTAVTVRKSLNIKNEESDNERIQLKKEAKDKVKIKHPPSIVFIRKGNKVKSQKVETGISDEGFIEITKGLKENQEIISGNYMAVSKLLRDGSKIKIDSTRTFKKKK